MAPDHRADGLVIPPEVEGGTRPRGDRHGEAGQTGIVPADLGKAPERKLWEERCLHEPDVGGSRR